MGASATLAHGVRRSDVVLTGVLWAASLVQVLTIQPLTGNGLADLVLASWWVLPLMWRRSHPVGAAAAWSAVAWVPVDGYLFVGYVIALLLFYSLGRWAARVLTGGLVCALAVGAGTVGTLSGPEDPVAGLLSWWLVVLAPYGFGLLTRVQERQTRGRLDAEREVVRQRAVQEERARLVRELHDVVGHEMTLMSIHSEAAAQAVASAPELAAGPIEVVRETAHRAHRELRAILNLLGTGDTEVEADGRGLADLFERAARAGIPTTLTVSGEPWTDTPQHWLAVNRIVQECLTNAGKHAPGQAVAVRLDWAPGAVSLEVVNAADAAPVAAHGLGLPGMAERARLLGGALQTSYGDGRFTVTAKLPAPDGAWT